MNSKTIAILTILTIVSSASYADCEGLMAKYNTPDPSVKTMKQLKRWVKRKVKDTNKANVERCLIDRAADNPNKSTVAGQ